MTKLIQNKSGTMQQRIMSSTHHKLLQLANCNHYLKFNKTCNLHPKVELF